MTNFFKSQIQQIAQSKSLTIYGAIVSFTHVLTFLYWNKSEFFVSSQSTLNAEPLCYPFFPNCDLWRQVLPDTAWTLCLYSYLLLGLFTGFLFITQKIQKAYFFFIALTLLKLIFQLSNYALSDNLHYITYFVSFIFIFSSLRSYLLKYFLTSCLVAVGIFHLHSGWLKQDFQSLYLHAFNIFIAFSQIALPLFLIHGNKWLRRISFIFVSILFALYWPLYGFFTSCMWTFLFSFFLIEELILIQERNKSQNLLGSLLNLKQPALIYITLFVFIGLQTVPFLISGDSYLPGAQQLLTVNGGSRNHSCQSSILVQEQNSWVEISPPIKNLGPRFKCDPLILLNQAWQLCRKNKDLSELSNMNIQFHLKHPEAHSFFKIIDIKNFCNHPSPLWAEFKKQDSI